MKYNLQKWSRRGPLLRGIRLMEFRRFRLFEQMLWLDELSLILQDCWTVQVKLAFDPGWGVSCSYARWCFDFSGRYIIAPRRGHKIEESIDRVICKDGWYCCDNMCMRARGLTDLHLWACWTVVSHCRFHCCRGISYRWYGAYSQLWWFTSRFRPGRACLCSFLWS